MSFTEKWDKAFESRDRDALSELLDDDFGFVGHQSGSEMTKDEMLNMWTTDGPKPDLKNLRIIYKTRIFWSLTDLSLFQSEIKKRWLSHAPEKYERDQDGNGSDPDAFLISENQPSIKPTINWKNHVDTTF